MKPMNTDEHDELWRLLGKAKKTEVSPFFARNILREIRTQKPLHTGILTRMLRRWRLTALTASALILLAAGLAPSLFRKSASSQSQAQLTTPDYDTINHLDELLAYEENSIWLDNSSD